MVAYGPVGLEGSVCHNWSSRGSVYEPCSAGQTSCATMVLLLGAKVYVFMAPSLQGSYVFIS